MSRPETRYMPTNQQPTPTTLPGWPTEPEYTPRLRSDTPAAWQRDAQEAARHGQQPQQVVIHHHYAAQRRGPDVQQVLGWTAVLGVVTAALLATAMVAIALGLAALAMAVLALIIRSIWRDLQR